VAVRALEGEERTGSELVRPTLEVRGSSAAPGSAAPI